jgi:hypothetical protein
MKIALKQALSGAEHKQLQQIDRAEIGQRGERLGHEWPEQRPEQAVYGHG